MTEILSDLSAPALITGIKANLFELYRCLGRSPAVELYESPNMTSLITGLPAGLMNGVLRTQLVQEDVDEAIEETLAHFKSRDVAGFSWWTEPGTQPTRPGKESGSSRVDLF